MKLCNYFLLFLLMLSCSQITELQAQTIISVDNTSVKVCQEEPNDLFSSGAWAHCKSTSLNTVDPQKQEIWFKATFEINDDYLGRKQPSALFLFGKMSSEVYLNGELLGSNGTPNKLGDKEFPGNMDARFYVPPQLIKKGKNEVVIRASAHHGLLTLGSPIHFIGLSEYGEPSSFFQSYLMIALGLLGALILGSIYIGTLVYQSQHRKNTSFLLLMAIFASGQLFIELSRALYNYSYPLHDVRLILIVVTAFGFGISSLAYTLDRFKCEKSSLWLVAGMLITLVSLIMHPNYDAKTTLAILLPSVLNLIITSREYINSRSRESLKYTAAFGVFSLTVILTFNDFHAMYFYYIVTLMMTFLIVTKAKELVIEKEKRKSEEQQVMKLNFILEQAQQQTKSAKLTINSAGKTDVLLTKDIYFCKASGDYVELYLKDKRTHLYHGTLKSLEKQLPSTFLKVHRSYIVNLDEVMSVVSSKDGNSTSGLLKLSDELEVPVSRRILPQVKNVLKEN